MHFCGTFLCYSNTGYLTSDSEPDGFANSTNDTFLRLTCFYAFNKHLCSNVNFDLKKNWKCSLQKRRASLKK